MSAAPAAPLHHPRLTRALATAHPSLWQHHCSPRRLVIDPPPSPSSVARAFLLSLLTPPRTSLVLPLWGAPVPAGLVMVSRVEDVDGVIFRFCKRRSALALVGRHTPTKIFQAKQAWVAMIGCLSGKGPRACLPVETTSTIRF